MTSLAVNPEVHPPSNSSPYAPNGILTLGDLKFWALGDRVLIQEDEFKSGYECTVCSGSGKTQCGECYGRGAYLRGGSQIKCSQCDKGSVTCPECKGKGGLIIAPETAQRRPTTGQVLSAGPACKVLSPGQNVMYSNFAGYVVDLQRAGKNVSIRILHETEVLCAMEGQLQLRNFKGKTEIAEFGG